MFKPRLVVRDQRSIFRKVQQRLEKLFSSKTVVIVPHNKVTTEYVSRTCKGIITGTLLLFSSLVSTVVYQTVFPSFDSQIVTEAATIAYKSSDQPVYNDFPYVIRDQEQNTTEQFTFTTLTREQHQEQFTCLAKNIYFEARSESLKGHIAVGLVTLNRVRSDKFPDTICDVVWQDRQFSWTHDGMSDQPTDEQAWVEAQQVADFMMTPQTVEHLHDFTDNALYYHANYVKPYWNRSYTKTAEVGLHIFYKTK